MTPELDRLLRNAVCDLADEARPASLVAVSLQRAGQIRARRRVTAMAAAACALIVALTVGYVVAPGRSLGWRQLQPATSASSYPDATPTVDVPPSEHPPATLAPTGPFLIRPGLMVVAAGASRRPSFVYDRARHHYVAVPASPDRTHIAAAPTGNLVALADYDRAGKLTDVSTGRSRDLDKRLTGSRGYAWSADGKRLAALELLIAGQNLIVTDAATGNTRRLPVGNTGCNDDCFVSWLPGNTEVAVAVTDRSVQHDESKADPQLGLQAYSVETGKPTRFLPVRGAVYGPQAWSPDGRYVVIDGLSATGEARVAQAQVVEVATGKVRSVLPARFAERVSWISNDEILVPVRDAVELRTVDWRLNDRLPLPAEFTDAEFLVVGPALP